MSLSDFEKEVIRMAAGLPHSITGWGAAVGASLGPLASGGYLAKTYGPDGLTYSVTEKGRKAVSLETET